VKIGNLLKRLSWTWGGSKTEGREAEGKQKGKTMPEREIIANNNLGKI